MKSLKFKKFKKIFFVVFIALQSGLLFAQDQKMKTIIQFDEYISTLRSEKNINSQLPIEKLVFEKHEAIYLENAIVKTFGDKPICFFVDSKNVKQIKNSDIKKENIEIVTIKINSLEELNEQMDFNVFSEFKNLKYIYLITSLNCSQSALERTIKNNNFSYTVLYNILKKS